MEDAVFKFDRFFEGQRHENRILQAHAVGTAHSVAGIVRGRDPSQKRIGCKYLTLASEVQNFWVRPCGDLTLKSIRMSDLLYEWSRVNHAAESVEVIKQCASVIDDKMDLGNRLLGGGKMLVAIDDEVGKYVSEMIALISSTAEPRTRCCDAIDQRDLRQIVQDALYALVGYGVSIEMLLVVKIKRGLGSGER